MFSWSRIPHQDRCRGNTCPAPTKTGSSTPAASLQRGTWSTVDLGILKEVKDEYTPWINSAVVTTKPNGSIRVCLDPRDLNKVIRCNRHYIRTIDDVIPQATGSTHFTILDARNGYWQAKLDEQSSRLCTFNTPPFWSNM